MHSVPAHGIRPHLLPDERVRAVAVLSGGQIETVAHQDYMLLVVPRIDTYPIVRVAVDSTDYSTAL